MREVIKKAVLKIFPELSGGLHLDRYARVLAVSDEPAQGGSCERFRPRYAVTLEILTPEGEKDAAYPIYKDVPLPVPAAGKERGSFGFPETGTLVVVGFAYGRPDHPLVRQIYPLGLSLPNVATGELLWQQDAETLQRVDPDGNWTRQTHGAITDSSLVRITRAIDSVAELVRDMRRVSGSSTEEIGGVKSVEALGGILLTSGGHIDMVAIDNLNFVTAADCSWVVARDWNGVTGGNHHHTVKMNMTENVLMTRTENTTQNHTETIGQNKSSTVMANRTAVTYLNHSTEVRGNRTDLVKKDHSSTVDGNRIRTVGQDLTESVSGDLQQNITGESAENVDGDKKIKAANIRLKGATFSITTLDGELNFFELLLDFIEEVRDALWVLDHHTHPSVAPIVEGPEVKTHADNIETIRGKMDIMTE
ncbi:phage baseplate assembly protein V [Maridesulfovibrio sp.]|uniref:phage baseplate assembly protein V n=1 Tax=Maridesulfovibrio sp. TaxID=2795000 RepID=UPI0029C9EB1E|nr:phage baseplate assembly protein V [Maridesulfovibrio sp.]